MKKYIFKNSVYLTIFVKLLKYEKSISLKDTKLYVKVIVYGGDPRSLVSIRVV